MKSTLTIGLSLFLLLGASVAWAQDEDPAEESAEPTETADEAPADEAEPEPPTRSGGGVTRDSLSGTSEGVNYDLRLQELEDRVNELKEEIFRSKSRLFLLRQQILQDNIGGSRAVITHNNLMSGTYRLVEVFYALDGNQIYVETADGGAIEDRIELYNSSILPGPHNISVQMVFEGNGYGIFSYMSGYRFTITSSHAFNADEGQTVMVDVVAYERGGINEPIEERPDIRYEVDLTDTTADVLEVGTEEE